ncbi:MAG: DUF1592 domain-containing protein, partial [Pirellulales bacterium]|nr:DUF1592 domain-containing protein [Pirellulales bacterium]
AKLPPEKRPIPYVALQEVQIETDYVASWPPQSWQIDVGELKDDDNVAEKLIALWTARAWRRPVKATERQRFVSLYKDLRSRDASFDDALRAAFQSVLMSGPFRYLASPNDEDPRVAHYAIASRLSFMLAGSPPDAEMRSLAAAGKLRDVKVLDEQVDRLIAAPRFHQKFVEPFVMQWLEMDQPITFVMDHFDKQDFRFSRHLKASMREETLRYVGQLFVDNRPAKELVVSDWTMMNN